MITHVGGLDSAAQATLDMLSVPGGKRLVYTHVNMPMTAIEDFTEKGKTDPFFAELDRLCSANNGLWCKAAEDYLLAHAPKVEIGLMCRKEDEEQMMPLMLMCRDYYRSAFDPERLELIQPG
jgi:hypothetical protein